jgi:hypothetical protein
MGSVRPARRFDALRAIVATGLPSRLAPDGGPPCAFALLQRSIAAPPHRPADPRARTSNDASFPELPCPTTHDGTADPFSRGFRPRGVPRSGFLDPHRGPHHRPSRRLAAPERPWASPFKAFPSQRSGPLSESHALLSFHASIRLAPMGSVRTRPPSGPRSRRESVLPFRIPKDPARRCLLGFHPSRAFLPPASHHRFMLAGDPSTRFRRFDVRLRLRPEVSECGRLGLSLSGPPALLGFATLRPSRSRCDRHGERAHGLASRRTRVAGGARRSVLPRSATRPGLAPEPGPAVHR